MITRYIRQADCGCQLIFSWENENCFVECQKHQGNFHYAMDMEEYFEDLGEESVNFYQE